ncbi:hypothetical protein [Candidatus Uabimicrobium sp. HlEnr_7]|uniref:hypothetical protein n=1 Tax=Candidatus Uabimicrobium helgolandensis TaxID=3095367 RepID=UPI003556408C
MEGGGKDEYLTKRGPGASGGNHYHGGSSLSIFLDLGGAEDTYLNARVKNNTVHYYQQHSLILDVSHKDLSEIKDLSSLYKSLPQNNSKD